MTAAYAPAYAPLEDRDVPLTSTRGGSLLPPPLPERSTWRSCLKKWGGRVVAAGAGACLTALKVAEATKNISLPGFTEPLTNFGLGFFGQTLFQWPFKKENLERVVLASFIAWGALTGFVLTDVNQNKESSRTPTDDLIVVGLGANVALYFWRLIQRRRPVQEVDRVHVKEPRRSYVEKVGFQQGRCLAACVSSRTILPDWLYRADVLSYSLLTCACGTALFFVEDPIYKKIVIAGVFYYPAELCGELFYSWNNHVIEIKDIKYPQETTNHRYLRDFVEGVAPFIISLPFVPLAANRPGDGADEFLGYVGGAVGFFYGYFRRAQENRRELLPSTHLDELQPDPIKKAPCGRCQRVSCSTFLTGTRFLVPAAITTFAVIEIFFDPTIVTSNARNEMWSLLAGGVVTSITAEIALRTYQPGRVEALEAQNVSPLSRQTAIAHFQEDLTWRLLVAPEIPFLKIDVRFPFFLITNLVNMDDAYSNTYPNLQCFAYFSWGMGITCEALQLMSPFKGPFIFFPFQTIVNGGITFGRQGLKEIP